jgi:plasmid stability protein
MQFACIVRVEMPKSIQIRDVPDDVHAVLRARAAASGMSMSEYLRAELIDLASSPTNEEIYARVQAREGPEPSRESIVEIIREARGPIPPE